MAALEDTATGINVASNKEFRSVEERDLWLDVYKSAMRQRFTRFPDGSTLEQIPEAKADDAVREYCERCWGLDRSRAPFVSSGAPHSSALAVPSSSATSDAGR